MTNQEIETIGERINADPRIVLEICRVIDRRCEAVRNLIFLRLDQCVEVSGDLAGAIARKCEIETGRMLWDAEFAGAPMVNLTFATR